MLHPHDAVGDRSTLLRLFPTHRATMYMDTMLVPLHHAWPCLFTLPQLSPSALLLHAPDMLSRLLSRSHHHCVGHRPPSFMGKNACAQSSLFPEMSRANSLFTHPAPLPSLTHSLSTLLSIMRFALLLSPSPPSQVQQNAPGYLLRCHDNRTLRR